MKSFCTKYQPQTENPKKTPPTQKIKNGHQGAFQRRAIKSTVKKKGANTCQRAKEENWRGGEGGWHQERRGIKVV